ncbi:Diphthamide biosynthesis protein 1 [Binucleata daphniae]
MVILQRKKENFVFENINEYTKNLPINYNFEIEKTLNTIITNKYRMIAIQMPDGLLKYAIIICDVIKRYTGAETLVLGDVVYGACCIDDKAAFDLGCDLLVHYGHSCLFPINQSKIRCMYIFVDIYFDYKHCVEMIKKIVRETRKCCTHTICSNGSDIKNIQNNVCKKSDDAKQLTMLNDNIKHTLINTNELENYDDITVIGTIQFNTVINKISKLLNITAPQIKPLSKGEVLGCTSPLITNKKTVIYISDGRFHLESIMINNPHLTYYKYCPFTKKMTKEYFDYNKMLSIRLASKKKAFSGKSFGLILGTLGRQGSYKIFVSLQNYLEKRNYKVYKIMLKEINEATLDSYPFIDAFVQVSCPRLSVDWGCNYKKPILNPYEVYNELDTYELQYYSKKSNKPWNN